MASTSGSVLAFPRWSLNTFVLASRSSCRARMVSWEWAHSHRRTRLIHITNVGKETVSLFPSASIFDSAGSFGMIRGGHIDVTILGAMLASVRGDLANFIIPGKHVKGIDSAMGLVSNPDKTRVIVAMEHCTKDGSPKILRECTSPLTGARAASPIITDLAVLDVDRHNGELYLIEIAPYVTVDEIRAKTGCDFIVSENLK
ncbi:B subunit of 3-oxoacid CoA-transferase [Boletus coccyginus]|nr:B subunit of 3-oxoacid CoA-transferase [Boletus coccyginus]